MEQAKYGEMTTLSVGTKTWVLLNTERVVNEIIAKRASLTHERPYFPIAGGLVSRNKRFFLYKTKDWRTGRRLINHLIMGPGSKDHGAIAEGESIELLNLWLDDPSGWYAHNYRYTVSVMHRIITNHPLQKTRAELDALQRVTSTFLTSINSSFVEFFPQLELLPRTFQVWRTHWEKMGAFHYSVFKDWWQGMRPLLRPDAKPSFIRDTVVEHFSDDDDQAIYLTALILSAGSDNPRMAINTWVMSCLAYPAVQEKARQEIDRVCGANADRLPKLEDMTRLPYMCAVVKETLRWRPIVPLVPQRVLVEDMDFEGYRFPAGTEFLVNSIPVCSNGYDTPSRFVPERWLGEKEVIVGVEQDLWQFAFSGGRRVCLGYKLAQKELFIALSRLLYCFDISPAGDFDDRKLNAFSPGEPFPVKITVRSAAHAKLICDETTRASMNK